MAWRGVKWTYNGNTLDAPVSLSASMFGAGQAVWYPLIPKGSFVDPEGGMAFEMTDAILAAMMQTFQGGAPGPNGIPIDELATHGKNPHGAFGHIKALDLRSNGLYGLLEMTPAGLEAIASGQMTYVSPHFTVGTDPSRNYGVCNIMEAAALCSSPLFWNQPGLRIAASMSTLAEAADAEAETEGGTNMPTEAELQAQIDELQTKLTDATTKAETVDTLTAAVAERDQTIVDLTTARDALQTELDALKADAASAAEKVTALTARLEALEAEAQARAVADQKLQIAASLGAQTFADPANAERMLRYAPAAIEVLGAMQFDPSAANVAAFSAHLSENGGHPAMVPANEVPALQTVKASLGSHGDAAVGDEDFFASEAFTDAKKAQVKTLMASNPGVPAMELYRKSFLR